MSNLTIDPSFSLSLSQQSGTLDRLKRNSLSASQSISSLSSGSGANSASASGFGQILNQLQNLATSDSAQFKQQTANIASKPGRFPSWPGVTTAAINTAVVPSLQMLSPSRAPGTSRAPRAHQEHRSPRIRMERMAWETRPIPLPPRCRPAPRAWPWGRPTTAGSLAGASAKSCSGKRNSGKRTPHSRRSADPLPARDRVARCTVLRAVRTPLGTRPGAAWLC